MRTLLLLAAAIVVSTAAAAPTADVTLSVERFYDAGNFIWRLRFSGAISSPTPNEYVAILGHQCGTRASNAISVAGDTTRPDGSWGPVVPGTGGLPDVAIRPPATYRGRWNGRFSQPVTIRTPMNISVFKLPGRRYRVSVYTSTPKQLQGKSIDIQRLAGGSWTRVRRVRMVPVGYGSFTATFTVRTRRLTMRAVVPANITGPCYLETVSKQWTT
jgi:hypothetical protein